MLDRRNSDILSTQSYPLIGKFVPTGEHVYARFVFTIFGISSLFMWNTFLSCSGVLIKYVYPSMGFMQSVQTSYMTSVLIGNLIMMLGYTRHFDPHRCTVIFNCIASIQALLLCLTVWFLDNSYYGYLLNILISSFIAFTCATLIPETFTLAAIMPENFCLDVSFGQSLSGVITFSLTLILNYMYPNNLLGKKLLVSTMFLISTVISLFSGFLAQTLSKYPWFYSCINDTKKISFTTIRTSVSSIHSEFNTNVLNQSRFSSIDETCTSFTNSINFEKEFYANSSLIEISKIIWPQLYNIFISFLVTLCVFPTMFTKWTYSNNDKLDDLITILLIGTFHLGDVIGRNLPNFGFLFPSSLLWILTTSRIIFIPLYNFVIYAPNTTFFGYIYVKFIIQFLLASTNGYCAYLAFIYGPDCVTSRSNKEKASFLLAIFNVAGMTIGTWLCNIFILLGLF